MKKKKLNILQVLPNLDSGGVERGTLEIAEYIVKKGHNSFVMSAGGRLVKKLLEQGSEHIFLPLGKKSPTIIFMLIKLISYLQTHKIDIVHARSRLPAWIVFLSLKFIKKGKRPKFVTTIHGYNSVSKYSSIMTKGEAVIIVSNSLKKFVCENYKIEESKIIVNHRGVPNLDEFYSHKSFVNWKKNWYKSNPHFKNKKLLTLPSRVSRHKGIEDFIKLIFQLKKRNIEIHGLIVGEAKSKNYLQELQNLIKTLKLTKEVSFLGFRSDIYEIMKESNIIFSLSSLPEAFGRIVIESIKLKTPVIG